MQRRTGSYVLLAALLLVVQTPLSAAVAPTTLKELTIASEQIVIGRVTSVFELKSVWVATLRVTETLKGPKVPEIAYLAQGTWTCDISGAEQGEEVLLFLQRYEFDPNPQAEHERDPMVWTSTFKEPAGFREEVDGLGLNAPFMAISWSGRGRMPIRYIDSETYVTIWTEDVELPPSVKTIDGPEQEYASFIRSVRMSEVVNFVHKWSNQKR